VYYFSISIVLFFINLCYGYSAGVYAFDGDGAIGRRGLFEHIDIRSCLPNYFSALTPEGALVFGYDYFTLIMCAMTALVFSFVYLINLFDENLKRKKLFYTCLLLVEMCVLLAFMSMNILSFLVFFESSLVPMALVIGL